MSKPKIAHPGLSSTFTGVYPNPSDNEIWQFRGIKFGVIPARFNQSILNEKFAEQYDATTYGPKCPHTNFPIRMEDALIGVTPDLATHQAHIFDEFECLNLNITTPAHVHRGSSLPVMLYIHGGGGHSGANSDWWNDGTSIVKQSIALGKPIVSVAINYRLAVLGWLGSNELRQQLGKENGCNFGMRDVHTGIEWVSKYIAPFGGDPSNITIYGESAGAQAVHSQISSLLPSYFSRAILQSMTLGTPVMSNPQTVEEKSWVYDRVKDFLKVTTVKELQEVSWEDLVEAYKTSDPRYGFGEVGMIDEEFYTESWRDRLQFAGGKGELLLGTTGNEQSVTAIVLLQYPKVETKPTAQTMIDNLKAAASPTKVDALLEAYDITSATTPEDVVERMLQWCGDYMFYAPANWISGHAKKHGVKVHEYGFEQAQPFGGIFKGVPSHSLDLAYIHGDPSVFSALPTAVKELAVQKEFQSTWIDFAYGELKWPSEKVKLFGPDGKVETVDEEVFLRDWRKGKAFSAINDFDDGEKSKLVFIVITHLGQLMGTTTT